MQSPSSSQSHNPDMNSQELALARLVRGWTKIHVILLVVAYFWLVIRAAPELAALLEAAVFFPVGILGAIIANSTGTGGGVVFVPVFAVFEIEPSRSVAMSFVIQCFGMSVGSLIWLNAFFVSGKIKLAEKMEAHALAGIVFSVLCGCIPSLLITQQILSDEVDQRQLLTLFKIFSIILGMVLLVFTVARDRFKPKKYRYHANSFDSGLLFLIGIGGGVVTAFFSVGVGEFLALYLIFRGFPTISSVVAAVWVSIVTVFCGVWQHLFSGVIDGLWPAVLLAVPGAMAGGYVARIFAALLGAERLKLFAALWITLSAAYLLLPVVFMHG
ncbi:MAG: sulfite exporter TauE/SafE family protein [Nitratireductor sp.]